MGILPFPAKMALTPNACRFAADANILIRPFCGLCYWISCPVACFLAHYLQFVCLNHFILVWTTDRSVHEAEPDAKGNELWLRLLE